MARLPQVQGDSGQWGQILNDFLIVSHNTNGTLKPEAITIGLQDGSVARTHLTAAVQASLDNADAAVSGSSPDASTTTKGLVQLTGDLSGTATNPNVADNAITNTKIADNSITSAKIVDGTIVNADISTFAAISQTKIAGLTADLADKYTTPANGIPESDLASTVQTKLNATPVIADESITSAKIANGTIVNTDISSSAAIATSKIAGLDIALADKASTTSNETLAGNKTFSGSTSFTNPITIANPTMQTHAATKEYVDGVASTGGTPDADATTKGKIQLAGDLTGTAGHPSVATGAITGTKIADGTITETKLASAVQTKLNAAGSGVERLFISDNAPTSTSGNYIWVETGLGINNTDMTFWVEDGQ